MNGEIAAYIAAFVLLALFAWEFYEIIIVDRFHFKKDPFVLPIIEFDFRGRLKSS